MSEPPFCSGDFIWSNFPQRENPARPGPPHIAYAVMVTGSTTYIALTAIIAYTTSRPWTEDAKPLGVFEFSRLQAAGMGQARAFTLDLRRLAWVPVTEDWFPQLATSNRGVLGRASEPLRRQFEEVIKELSKCQLIEHLGPSKPR